MCITKRVFHLICSLCWRNSVLTGICIRHVEEKLWLHIYFNFPQTYILLEIIIHKYTIYLNICIYVNSRRQVDNYIYIFSRNLNLGKKRNILMTTYVLIFSKLMIIYLHEQCFPVWHKLTCGRFLDEEFDRTIL